MANRMKGNGSDGNPSTVRWEKQLTGVIFRVFSSMMTCSHNTKPMGTGFCCMASSQAEINCIVAWLLGQVASLARKKTGDAFASPVRSSCGPVSRLLRRHRHLDRVDPVLVVRVVVQVGTARRTAVLAGDAADQVEVHLDLLVRGHLPPVEHQLAAADLEGA